MNSTESHNAAEYFYGEKPAEPVVSPDTSKPALRVRRLAFSAGSGVSRTRILRGIDAEFPSHQWTSIMGPSGSGKTTLLHCLSGLAVPSGGTVQLSATDGSTIDISALSEGARAKLRTTDISIVFQDFNLVPVLNVEDNIRLPRRLAGSRGRRRSEKAPERGRQSGVSDAELFSLITTTLGIEGLLKRLPSQLSGGQRQRVAIARSLFTRPAVILADEPTGSLDSETGQAVLELFRRVVDEFNQTLIMVTHDEHAAQHGDSIVRMKDGRIVDIQAVR